MKSFFNAILDGLTFKDITGKRQPRTYTVLTGALLILMLVLAACVALERNAMLEEVQSTPQLVQVTLEPTTAPETDETVADTCPNDPADWTFVEVLPGDNFKRIAESCVYDGLAKSVAWALAVREGHTRAEATAALGFAEAPMRRLNENLPILEVADPLTLDDLYADPRAAQYLLTRLGPTVAPGEMDNLLARLIKLGHTPKVLEA